MSLVVYHHPSGGTISHVASARDIGFEAQREDQGERLLFLTLDDDDILGMDPATILENHVVRRNAAGEFELVNKAQLTVGGQVVGDQASIQKMINVAVKKALSEYQAAQDAARKGKG